MHIIAAKAIAFKEAMSDDFKAYQKQVVINARAMASIFLERGYDVVSGGTDNHVFLVSFIDQGLTGKAVNNALGEAHITVNMNSVPNDPQSPFVTSGIRVGTPAGTTRGFGESQCKDITNWICDICDNLENESVIDEVRAKVEELCSRFPVYKQSQCAVLFVNQMTPRFQTLDCLMMARKFAEEESVLLVEKDILLVKQLI